MEILKLSKTYLSHAITSKYSIESNFLSPFMVSVVSNSGDACYTHQHRRWGGDEGTFGMSLGDTFYSSVRKVDSSFDIPMDKESMIYGDISLMYDAVFYHELGHILYTPIVMADSIRTYIMDQNGNQFAALFSSVINIIEDVVIEAEIRLLRPFSTPCILHLRRTVFSHVPDEITADMAGALNTMLHNFRTVSNVFVHYPDEELDKFINAFMSVCINTQDPNLRLARTLAFSAAIWDVFNNKEQPDLTYLRVGLDEKFYVNLPEKYKDKEDNQTVDSNMGNPDTGDFMRSASEMDGSAQPMGTTSGDDATAPMKGEAALKNPPKPSTVEPDTNVSMQDVLAAAKANDQNNDDMAHIFVTMNSKYDSKEFLPAYLDVVTNYQVMISQISAIIKKRKVTNLAYWETGKSQGKLNPKAFSKRTHKIFKQKTTPGHEADLAISILVDNSGSMYGQKTKICGEALIVLSEVCNRLKIPFEVNAFTQSWHTAYTIGLKSFTDDYNKVKTNLSLIEQGYKVNDLRMYQSNVDEVNLNFVWRNFKKKPQKDKVIIVISDGETCGSQDALTKLAHTIERDNITLLGLGIKSRNVRDIYSNSHIFNTNEDLQELPKFLNDYLVNIMFKKGGE